MEKGKDSVEKEDTSSEEKQRDGSEESEEAREEVGKDEEEVRQHGEEGDWLDEQTEVSSSQEPVSDEASDSQKPGQEEQGESRPAHKGRGRPKGVRDSKPRLRKGEKKRLKEELRSFHPSFSSGYMQALLRAPSFSPDPNAMVSPSYQQQPGMWGYGEQYPPPPALLHAQYVHPVGPHIVQQEYYGPFSQQHPPPPPFSAHQQLQEQQADLGPPHLLYTPRQAPDLGPSSLPGAFPFPPQPLQEQQAWMRPSSELQAGHEQSKRPSLQLQDPSAVSSFSLLPPAPYGLARSWQSQEDGGALPRPFLSASLNPPLHHPLLPEQPAAGAAAAAAAAAAASGAAGGAAAAELLGLRHRFAAGSRK
ncbi:hypothetical protein GUITHDRAFT_148182 [Guillardia theta CCMP2712]|uniref:Uncharacterized protein n=1 Tax=Guillardia theta (strain CCMP2712) TaxID=905079 RepID=L1IB65_GUITC|nr:hypothetical protein GUITHDRAFT_148182 [Guillardia theta CCMP2712]EKX33090.1 hypothetical protein GUITHDRAFT_148182 [Guillardia theta CCMP2712]|eukprot:XP_005820070.1 hypothetical protein GUITHDRAFT_148182 [Guillardia theta CCMP2712]